MSRFITEQCQWYKRVNWEKIGCQIRRNNSFHAQNCIYFSSNPVKVRFAEGKNMQFLSISVALNSWKRGSCHTSGYYLWWEYFCSLLVIDHVHYILGPDVGEYVWNNAMDRGWPNASEDWIFWINCPVGIEVLFHTHNFWHKMFLLLAPSLTMTIDIKMLSVVNKDLNLVWNPNNGSSIYPSISGYSNDQAMLSCVLTHVRL